MNYSSFTKNTMLLVIFLVSCQVSPRIVANSPTETAIATPTPDPTSTSDPQVISPNNANQIVLKAMNMGKASSSGPMYSLDGKWLYVASNVGMYAFDTVSYTNISLLAPMPFSTLSLDGKIGATWQGQLFSVNSTNKLPNLESFPGLDTQPGAQQTKFSHDNSLIMRHYNFTLPDLPSHVVAVWRLTDGKLINTFKGETMELSADNNLIAVQLSVYDKPNAYDYHVYLYDLQSGKLLDDWLGERPAFLSDNSLVMESDGYVRIFDPKTHKARHVFEGKFATFSPNEEMIAVLLNDSINIYRVANGKLLRKLKVELSSIDRADLAFSANGQILAGFTVDAQCCSGHTDNLSIWRVADGSLIKKLRPSGFIFSPDGQTILAGGQILRTSDGSLIADLPPSFIGSVTNLAFTPDGQQIIVASYDNLYLYPVAGEPVWVPQIADPETYLPILKAASPHSTFGLPDDMLPPEEIHSPNGKFLAKNHQGIVTIWNTAVEGESFTIPAEPNAVALSFPTNGQRVTRVAFSADDQLAAFGLRAGTVELWDLNRKQKIFTIQPLVDSFYFVGGLAFSPDGKLLAIGSEDGIVRLL